MRKICDDKVSWKIPMLAVFCLCTAFLFSACVTEKSDQKPVSPDVLTNAQFDGVFRDRIPEPFFFRLRNQAAKDCLKKDASRLSPDRRLEMDFLRLIQGAEKEEEISGILAANWGRNQAVKDFVVNYKGMKFHQQPEFIPPLCLFAYLAYHSNIINQKELLDKLSGLDANKVMGYAFHFYFLSLIKCKDWKNLGSRLAHLKKMTDNKVFADDLNFIRDKIVVGPKSTDALMVFGRYYWESLEWKIKNKIRDGQLEDALNEMKQYKAENPFLAEVDAYQTMQRDIFEMKRICELAKMAGFEPLPRFKTVIKRIPEGNVVSVSFDQAEAECRENGGRLPIRVEFESAGDRLRGFNNREGELCWERKSGQHTRGKGRMIYKDGRWEFAPFVASDGEQIMEDVSFRCVRPFSSFTNY